MKHIVPRVWLTPLAGDRNSAATFLVQFSGLPHGTRLTLDFFEVDPPANQRHERRKTRSGSIRIGSIQGTVIKGALASQLMGTPQFQLQPDPAAPPGTPAANAASTPAAASTDPSVSSYVVPSRVSFVLNGVEDPFVFTIPDEAADIDEGDWWEFQVRSDSPKMQSKIEPVARMRRGIPKTLAGYHWHSGNQLQLFNDGSTDANGSSGALSEVVKAIEGAQHFVFVVDWSFHPLFRPSLGNPDSRQVLASLQETIGACLLRKAQQGLTVAIHTWDHTAHFAEDSQNDGAEKCFKALAAALGTKVADTLLWRGGSPDGITYSHHQKFVLVDQPGHDGRRAFRVLFGGLDLTKGRLDWPGHIVSARDAILARRRAEWQAHGFDGTNEWYNAETEGDLDLPRQAWHDIHACLDGPATWDFMREFMVRWAKPASFMYESGAKPRDQQDPVAAIWTTVRDHTKWVQQWDGHPPGQDPWVVQVVRSNVSDRCGIFEELRGQRSVRELQQALPGGTEASILEMYRQGIQQAERFIYIENQYVIGSGATWGRKGVHNDIPQLLAAKILDKKKKGQPFHVYIITPMFPEGGPLDHAILEVRNYEWQTLQSILRTLGDDWEDYLSLYFLAQWEALDSRSFSSGKRHARLQSHQRYMVYVHSKFMIVDDRFLVLGSANLNERSLAGNRDTEIACGMWPDRDREQECKSLVRKFREELLKEHFGAVPAASGDPSSSDFWLELNNTGDQNYVSFRAMNDVPKGHACRMPARLVNNRLVLGEPMALEDPPPLPDAWNTLPDAPSGGGLWMWQCRGSLLPLSDLAE